MVSIDELSAMLGLIRSFEAGEHVVTRRLSGISALLEAASCIDMSMLPLASQSSSSHDWEDAPGDHCWVIVNVHEIGIRKACPRGPTKRRCRDNDA